MQFLRFLCIGAINTLFGYAVFAVLIFLHLHYTIAVLLATCAGIIFNFYTLGTYVFNSTSRKHIIKFIGVYAIGYLINISMIQMLLTMSSNLYLNGAIATMITVIITYLLNKKFTFNEQAIDEKN
jgi:putative flippase GtrA